MYNDNHGPGIPYMDGHAMCIIIYGTEVELFTSYEICFDKKRRMKTQDLPYNLS